MGARPRRPIPDPVAEEYQHGSRYDGWLWAASIERKDDDGRYEDEGKEEGGAEPVDRRFGDRIVLRDRRRVGREGEPLYRIVSKQTGKTWTCSRARGAQHSHPN